MRGRNWSSGHLCRRGRPRARCCHYRCGTFRLCQPEHGQCLANRTIQLVLSSNWWSGRPKASMRAPPCRHSRRCSTESRRHAPEQHRCLGAGTHVSANQCRARKSATATAPPTAAMRVRDSTFAPMEHALKVEFFLKLNKNVEGDICRDYGQQHLATYGCKVGDVNCL